MIVLDILGILALIALVVIIIKINKKPDYISLKESLDLTNLPIVTFYQHSKKLNFILDTGSTMNIIDANIIKKLQHDITTKGTNVTGIGGEKVEVPLTELNINYKNKEFNDLFQIVDMNTVFTSIKNETGVTLHGLIGNSFMQKYKYVLDFDEMVAYSKHK